LTGESNRALRDNAEPAVKLARRELVEFLQLYSRAASLHALPFSTRHETRKFTVGNLFVKNNTALK